MSKFGKIFLLIITLLIGTSFTLVLVKKSTPEETVQNWVSVHKGTIEKKQLYPGDFQFSKKVELKSKMNGILGTIYKQVGDSIHVGEVIAEVKTVMDPASFENARKQLRIAEINYENKKVVFDRQNDLFKKRVISHLELEGAQIAYDLAVEEVASAKDNLFIARNGYSANSSNKVVSTSSGIILSIPFKEGSSIVKRNDYNEGTTIAVIGNMKDLSFSFYASEKDIINLKEGMAMDIYINALDSGKVSAKIRKIDFNSTQQNNLSKYLVEAQLDNKKLLPRLRMGFTGTAELLLKKRSNIVMLEEKHLFFKNDSAFVKRIDKNGKTKNQFVKTGLSNDAYVEITEGLKENDKVELAQITL